MNLRFENAEFSDPDFQELEVSKGRDGREELIFMLPFKANIEQLQVLSLESEEKNEPKEIEYSESSEIDKVLDEISYQLVREIESLTDEKIKNVNEMVEEFFDGDDGYKVRSFPIGVRVTGNKDRVESYFHVVRRH